MNCIACGRALEPAFEDSPTQPKDGLHFSSPGHYGSSFFDPLDGTLLNIWVCDLCLENAVKVDTAKVTRGA